MVKIRKLIQALKYFAIVLIFIGEWAHASSLFQLQFKNTGNLDFIYSIYELPPNMSGKVGAMGSLQKVTELGTIKILKDGSIELNSNEDKILALVVEAKKTREVDFYVSPHSNNQPQYDLDFRFNCLCYGHVYHLEKGKSWFRILKLSTKNLESKIKKKNEVIQLSHDFIEIEKNKK